MSLEAVMTKLPGEMLREVERLAEKIDSSVGRLELGLSTDWRER